MAEIQLIVSSLIRSLAANFYIDLRLRVLWSIGLALRE
jgi:hypothetical protein